MENRELLLFLLLLCISATPLSAGQAPPPPDCNTVLQYYQQMCPAIKNSVPLSASPAADQAYSCPAQRCSIVPDTGMLSRGFCVLHWNMTCSILREAGGSKDPCCPSVNVPANVTIQSALPSWSSREVNVAAEQVVSLGGVYETTIPANAFTRANATAFLKTFPDQQADFPLFPVQDDEVIGTIALVATEQIPLKGIRFSIAEGMSPSNYARTCMLSNRLVRMILFGYDLRGSRWITLPMHAFPSQWTASATIPPELFDRRLRQAFLSFLWMDADTVAGIERGVTYAVPAAGFLRMTGPGLKRKMQCVVPIPLDATMERRLQRAASKGLVVLGSPTVKRWAAGILLPPNNTDVEVTMSVPMVAADAMEAIASSATQRRSASGSDGIVPSYFDNATQGWVALTNCTAYDPAMQAITCYLQQSLILSNGMEMMLALLAANNSAAANALLELGAGNGSSALNLTQWLLDAQNALLANSSAAQQKAATTTAAAPPPPSTTPAAAAAPSDGINQNIVIGAAVGGGGLLLALGIAAYYRCSAGMHGNGGYVQVPPAQGAAAAAMHGNAGYAAGMGMMGRELPVEGFFDAGTRRGGGGGRDRLEKAV